MSKDSRRKSRKRKEKGLSTQKPSQTEFVLKYSGILNRSDLKRFKQDCYESSTVGNPNLVKIEESPVDGQNVSVELYEVSWFSGLTSSFTDGMMFEAGWHQKFSPVAHSY